MKEGKRKTEMKRKHTRKVLGLKLSIFSSQGFYKKITILDIKLDENLLK